MAVQGSGNQLSKQSWLDKALAFRWVLEAFQICDAFLHWARIHSGFQSGVSQPLKETSS